jgi:hypothetical protein
VASSTVEDNLSSSRQQCRVEERELLERFLKMSNRGVVGEDAVPSSQHSIYDIVLVIVGRARISLKAVVP